MSYNHASQAIIKPQYVDHIPRAIKGIVGEILTEKNENENKDYIMDMLDLANVTGRGVQARTHIFVLVKQANRQSALRPRQRHGPRRTGAATLVASGRIR